MDNSLKNGPLSVQSLLKNLVTSQEANKVKCLQLLGKLIFQNSKLKEEFLEAGGISIVLNYLNHGNPAIVGTAYHVLGFSLNGNGYSKRKLSTLKVFSILKKHLKSDLHFLKKCALFLTATIVEGNDLGQAVVRESGCLYHLVKTFYTNLQPVHSQVTEEELMYWTFLCPALKTCVENPHNHINQHQAGLIIPKAIAFLENWFQLLCDKYLAEKTELLVSVLISVLRENETNQLGFAEYSGLRWLIRGLQALAGWQSVPNNVDTLRDKLIALLAVAVEKNPSNCEESTSYGAVPLLLFILVNAKDKHKLRPLLALTHLVHNCCRSKEEFIQENGIASVVKATVNSETFPDTSLAAKRLLKYCAADVAQIPLVKSDSINHNDTVRNGMPCSSDLADNDHLVHTDKNEKENISNMVSNMNHKSKSSSDLAGKVTQPQNINMKNATFNLSKHVKSKRNLLCANCTTCSSSSQSSYKLKNTSKQRQYCENLSDANSSSVVYSPPKNTNSGQIRERFSRLHLYSTEIESSQNERSKGRFSNQHKIQENANLNNDNLISKKQHSPCMKNDFMCTVNKSSHSEVQGNNSKTPHGKGKSESLIKFNVAPRETSTEQQTDLIQFCDNITTNKAAIRATDICESHKYFHHNSALCEQDTQNLQGKHQRHISKKHCNSNFKYITENSQNASGYTAYKNQNGRIIKHNKNKLSKISQSDTEVYFKKPLHVIAGHNVDSKSYKNKNNSEFNQLPSKRKYIKLSNVVAKPYCCCREISNGNCNVLESFKHLHNKARRFRNCQSDIEAKCLKTDMHLPQYLSRQMSSKHNYNCEDSNTESVVSDTIKSKIKKLHNNKYKEISFKRMLQDMQSESQTAKIERYLNSYSNEIKASDCEENRGSTAKALDSVSFVVIPVSADAQSMQPLSKLSTLHQSSKNVQIYPVRDKESNGNSVTKSYHQVAETNYNVSTTQEPSDYISVDNGNMHSFLRTQNVDVSTVSKGDAQENDAYNCESESMNSAETEKRTEDKEKQSCESTVVTEKMCRSISQDVSYSKIQNTKNDGIMEELLKNISSGLKKYMDNLKPSASTHNSPESTKWFTPQESISSKIQFKQYEKIRDQENHSVHSQMRDISDECSVTMSPAFPCSFEASQQCFSEPIQTPLSHHKNSCIQRKQLFPAQTDNTHFNKPEIHEHERDSANLSGSTAQERPKETHFKDEATVHKCLIEENFSHSSRNSCLSESRIQMKRRRRENKHYRLLKYTENELKNLILGVQKYGKDFKAIRRAYCFHRKRSAKDLYLKWRLYSANKGKRGKTK